MLTNNILQEGDKLAHFSLIPKNMLFCLLIVNWHSSFDTPEANLSSTFLGLSVVCGCYITLYPQMSIHFWSDL